jgi:hypothetical protein
MQTFSNIFWLGTKELRSFMHDFVLLGLVIYTFSLCSRGSNGLSRTKGWNRWCYSLGIASNAA